MSSILRLPESGELLWSTFTRLQARFPSLGPKVFDELLSGNLERPFLPDLPGNLAALCASMQHHPRPEPEVLLFQNTMFHFAAPFLPQTITDALKNCMFGSATSDPAQYRAQARYAIGNSRLSHLKFCPTCAANDSKRFSTPIWRCIHQIGNLMICPEDGTPLQTTPVSFSTLRFVPLSEVALLTSTTRVDCSLQNTLAQSVSLLKTNQAPPYGPDRLRAACQFALKEAGRSFAGRLAADDLVSELRATFGSDRLQNCGAGLDTSSHCWVNSLFERADSRARPLCLQHYSAVCSLLKISLSDLFDFADQVGEADLVGPWKCCGKGKPCSGQSTIQCKRYSARNQSFRFQCPACGTAYFRQAPLRIATDGSFTHSLVTKRKTTEWATVLMDVWSDPGQSWKSLTARFNVSKDALGWEAAKLGLRDMPGRKLTSYRKKIVTSVERSTAIETKRSELGAYLARHPKAAYADLPRDIAHIYDWLRRNDTRPLPRLGSKKANSANGSQKRHPSQLVSRDTEIANRIIMEKDEAISQLTKACVRRISTRAVLLHFSPKYGLCSANLDAMPMTRGAIASMVETPDAARERRLLAICETLKRRPVLERWHIIHREFNCSRLRPDELAKVRGAYLERASIDPRGSSRRRHT